MNTATRKEREIREREELILDVARRLLVEHGYLGLTMDKVAAEIEYSKGTIYQHFGNKEEILAALHEQTTGLRVSLFERAATFPGEPRQRLAGIGVATEILARLHPLHFKSQQLIDVASIRNKIPEERRRQIEAMDNRCATIVSGIARDAIARGDLVLSPPDTPETIVFGLWTMSMGAHMIAAAGHDLDAKGFGDAQALLSRNYDVLLDGYGWQRLSTEYDYAGLRERILEEVFADEYRQITRGA